MLEKLIDMLKKRREVVMYLIFGVLTTLVNFVGYWILSTLGLSTGWANGIALVASILFAYVTNRIWVFESRTTGRAALKEFASFIACRAGTGLLDQALMILGVDVLGLWDMGMKAFVCALVIALNYVFSKLIIFAKKK